ncbi:MAG: hypothetical protein GQF41_4168 [Candidatus Rifleibacterium amylolyticum]|nr:MAG: hypothetical protein GQF41_4168 [Candidatus Rifleibacterium amylolyticum]
MVSCGMAKVYFSPLSQRHDASEVSATAAKLLGHIVVQEGLRLRSKVPLKVHFGEKGNQTFLGPENYAGIIDFLQAKQVESCYIESNVLYGGRRNNRTNHLITAREHGFTQLPVEIADGEVGQDYYIQEIEGSQFKKCYLASGFQPYEQFIVLAHFKGHTLAGFGGALKQLAMGFASRGGKMAQHQSAKPFIIPFLCRKCGACRQVCAVDAINLQTWWPRIDRQKCVGCAACTAACPHHAIHTNYLRFLMLGSFTARLAEYAYAAQIGKQNIYLNFAMNLTAGCDCEGRKMTPLLPDIGIFTSTDPVAIDKACLDKIDAAAGKTVFRRGRELLDYTEKLGMGTQQYQLELI